MKRLSLDIKKTLGDKARHIVARAGQSQTRPDDPKAQDGDRFGMVFITVDEETKNFIPHTQILRELQSLNTSLYAHSVTFEAMANGPPVGEDIEATLRSDNKENLALVATAIHEEFSAVDGITDLKIDDIVDSDEISVEIDNQLANRLGLDVANIGETLATFIAGSDVSEVTLNNKKIYLHLRSQREFRDNLNDLTKLTVSDNRGNLIPLGTFVKFKTMEGKPRIKRYDFRPSKTILGSVDEQKLTVVEANRKLQEIFEGHNSPDISLRFGGVSESTDESLSSMRDAFFLSVVAIFALLVFLFKSYTRPLIVITTIPLGLLGQGVAFFLHSKPVSFMALVGLVGLGGIIVNSGIVLISFIDQLRRESSLDLWPLLSRASRVRLKAVIVTSLTTIGGLIPTAYGIGGSDAALIPMTLAMAWGLSSGTYSHPHLGSLHLCHYRRCEGESGPLAL